MMGVAATSLEVWYECNELMEAASAGAFAAADEEEETSDCLLLGIGSWRTILILSKSRRLNFYRYKMSTSRDSLSGLLKHLPAS